MSDAIYLALGIAGAVAAAVGGWLYLRKMQACRRWILAVYPAFCAALLAAGLIWRRPDATMLGFYPMLPLLAVIAVEDMLSHRIANRLLLILLAVGVLCLAADWRHAVSKVLGLAAYGGVFVLISLLTRNGFGMGDAKLCGVVALFFGLIEMMTALFCASLVMCVVGIVVLVYTRNIRKEIPFAPAMLAGVLAAMLWGV